jgi:AraC-like DNA-binding protein
VNFSNIIPPKAISLFVKNILIFEDQAKNKKSMLPFFADGYPGIMFQQTKNASFLYPKKKKLSDFFMYGQTIKPIEISVKGPYRLIVFQLYPFAAKALFKVNAKELNDDCYDLKLTGGIDVRQTIQKLTGTSESAKQVKIITEFLSQLTKHTINQKEQKIQLAIIMIMECQGKITVKTLTQKLHTTERTLQRRFEEYVGVSPKQFAKIIQFQSSFNHISEDAFTKLTEVVYENGYADQSHFIRSFKKFTGQNPSIFKPAK